MKDVGSLMNFRFLNLHVEIRLLIYAELLLRPEPIRFKYERLNRRPLDPEILRAQHSRLTKTLYPAVLQCSKQVYYEAMSVLYGLNTFQLEPKIDPRPWVHDFLTFVGGEQARELKHMVVSMTHYTRYCGFAAEMRVSDTVPWPREFEFELVAEQTGVRRLDIELSPTCQCFGVDWVFRVDHRLRRAREPRINVTILLIVSRIEDCQISEDLLLAWEIVGWSYQVVARPIVTSFTCCRYRATCSPDCDLHNALEAWGSMFKKGVVRDASGSNRSYWTRFVWVGRTDWVNKDLMPDWPEIEPEDVHDDPRTSRD